MRVVHVYKDYPPVFGGIEQHLRLLAETQVRQGLSVTVLVARRRGLRTRRDTENGVEVVRVGRLATLASTPIAPVMPLVLGRLETDVTHLHFPHPMGEVAHWLRGAGPTVVSYHADIVRQRVLGRLYAPLMGRILAGADRILAASQRHVDGSPVLRRFADRVALMPLGIDLDRFDVRDPKRIADAAVRWPAERPESAAGQRVLFVGRLRYYKGVEHLIDALARTADRLVIVGEGPRGPTLRQRAAESPAAARIRFLGDVDEDDLSALYAAADVLVLPSTQRAEAFGIVQVEAMAAGTPVIATELGTGTSEVNRHGETGLIVRPGDVDALADALRALAGDPARRAALGSAARARARERHDVEAYARTLQQVYTEAGKGRRARPRSR